MIADALNAARRSSSDDQTPYRDMAIDDAAEALADRLAAGNPKFSRGRFLTAAGYMSS